METALVSTNDYGLHAELHLSPTTTPYAPHRRRLGKGSVSFSSARALLRVRGATLYALGARGSRGAYGGRTRDRSSCCCSRGLHLRGVRAYAQRLP